MYTTDVKAFNETLDRLAVVFPKELSDQTRTVYWEALKHVDIRVVRECAKRHESFGKFFPKPVELRPKDDKPPLPIAGDASGKDALARCVRNLDELKREDPAKWECEVRAIRNARVLATTFAGTPEHEAARRVDHQLRQSAGWITHR